MSDRTCEAPGCDRKVLARGLCSTHYDRVRRTGKLELVPRTSLTTVHSVHHYLRNHYGSARTHLCVDCGKPAVAWSYDGDCPDEKTQRGRHGEGSIRRFCPHPDEHYSPRCQPCHTARDYETQWRRGATHGRAKLDKRKVALARLRHRGLRHRDGETVASLAREHGVDWSTMKDAIDKTTWKHVNEDDYLD